MIAGMHLTAGVQAAETKTTETKTIETKAGETKAGEKAGSLATHAIPFQGSVVSIDPVARTFTLNGKAKERVFKVSPQTEILLDNKMVQFNSIVVGSVVRGSAARHEDGWEAKKVMMGTKESIPASDIKK